MTEYLVHYILRSHQDKFKHIHGSATLFIERGSKPQAHIFEDMLSCVYDSEEFDLTLVAWQEV